MDTSRRRFLQGSFQPQPAEAIRLPWVISEAHFISGCTRCGDCISACPQQVVQAGDGGFPTLDFAERECTFCQECVKACKQPLFDTEQAPWHNVASIDDSCLTHSGIVCQNCKDACTPRAIRFQFSVGGIAKPEIDEDACNGCGACIAPCPTDSIGIQPLSHELSVSS